MKGKESFTPAHVPMRFVLQMTLTHTLTYILAGVLVHVIDNSIPYWVVPLCSYIAEVFALLTHWAGHHRWNMWWHNAHMGHHINDYPPTKFLSDGYQKAKKDNSKAYYLTILITPIVTCWLIGDFSRKMIVINSFPAVLLLLFADYVHQGIHTKGFHLEKYNWFMMLRSLHYYHHKGDMMKNYAIGNFFLDFLFLGFQN